MFYWKKINILLFILLILFTIPAVYQLASPGLIKTDDLTWMVIRLGAFFNTLKDGQIPVRVLEGLNNGYSYPVANFLYPGFLYLGSAIHILGAGFVDSVKIMMIGSVIGSGIFTYLWLKKFFDPYASFIGSLFYIYTPYHLFDIYARGSIGEALAIMIFPLVLVSTGKKNLFLVSIGIFSLIIFHNSLALIFLPILFIYSYLTKNLKLVSFGALLGIGMSSFFIIPALYELKFVQFSGTTISDPLKYFAEPKLIGYSSLLVLIFSMIFIALHAKYKGTIPNVNLFVFFIFTLIIAIFMSSEVSKIIWIYLPSQFIQFPFRILALTLIPLAFISSFFVQRLNGSIRIFVMVIILIMLGFSSKDYLKVKGYDNYDDNYYLTNMDTTTVKDEYMPKWVNQKPLTKAISDAEITVGSATVKLDQINSKKIIINYENNKNATVRINRIYYPGWVAYINYEKVPILYNNDYGVMDIKLTRELGRVVLVFEETRLRFFSNFVTIVSLLIGLFIFFKPILKFK